MSSTQTDTHSTPSQTIIVSSQNPVKINATAKAFATMFPTSLYTTLGISVPSGVPSQPLSDTETLQGALNRVHNASAAKPGADYYVGLEGGLQKDGDLFQSFAWIVVKGKDGRIGKARTATFYLPREVAKLVEEGMELGHADDVVFGTENSKQKGGATGLLTGGVLAREVFYEQGVVLALIPFRNLELAF